MGRYAASTTKTTLDLDPKLRRQADHWALGRGLKLRHMVEQGLRLVMRKGGRG
jgi:hypothetical protein